MDGLLLKSGFNKSKLWLSMVRKDVEKWLARDGKVTMSVVRPKVTRNRTMVIEKIVEGDLDLIFDHVTSAFGG